MKKPPARPSQCNLIWWIRARHMKCIDYILRLKKDRNDKERLINQAVKHVHDHRREGDLLMDMDDNMSWTDMLTQTKDRDKWRTRTTKMRSKSNVTVTQKRREAKTDTDNSTAARSTSIYNYHLKLPASKHTNGKTDTIGPDSPSSNRQQLRADTLRRAHNEFVAGSAIDRKHLQQQTKKVNLKEKQKTRQAK